MPEVLVRGAEKRMFRTLSQKREGLLHPALGFSWDAGGAIDSGPSGILYLLQPEPLACGACKMLLDGSVPNAAVLERPGKRACLMPGLWPL